MNLAILLGLRPLDRVQINSRREREERDMWRFMNAKPEADLPYFFVQRLLADGAIEVRSPNGGVWSIRPQEICNVIPGVPVSVRAMPRAMFVDRLRSSPPAPATDQDYRPALVRYVSKDRWNRIDQVYVSFLEEGFNDADKFASPIHPDDRAMLSSIANRSKMPVTTAGGRGGAYSADGGVDTAQRLADATVSAFRRCALVGDTVRAKVLREAGLKTVSRVSLNRLMALSGT